MFVRLLLLCLVIELSCASASSSNNIAQRLMDRYNDDAMECIDKKIIKPAFQCSGLLMRALSGVGGPLQKYAWSKKPFNSRKNAFSLTFLRKDVPFSNFFNHFVGKYESGLIYYPHLKTPSNKYTYRAFCAFPISARTEFRRGEHGCGEYFKDTKNGQSRDCGMQGINTLKKWKAHFQNVLKTNGEDKIEVSQCSFSMIKKDMAKSFALALEAKKALRHSCRVCSPYQIEIVVRAWNENFPEKLPIEAFFYLTGFKRGREEAFRYQSDYFKLTNETVPVVAIQLPTDNDLTLHVELDEKF